MIRVLLPLTLAAGIQLAPPPPQPPAPRDPDRAERPTTGTGVIRGRVTDRETGQPISRAIVVAFSDTALAETVTRLEAHTSSDGRYELKGLPAGEYSVMVRAGEFRVSHLPQAFGDDRPGSLLQMGQPGRRLRLAEGEVRENTNVALWRAMAIEGRVVDEFGEPMAGVEISAHVAGTGQRPAISGPFQFPSDDRGLFRIYGLAPGRYTVCANPRNFAPMPSGSVRDSPIRTCYPAAVIDADAQEVTIVNGDVGGIEIRVQRSRTYTVSGTAVDSSGAPLGRGELSVMRLERSGSSGTGLETGPSGEFVARGLIPGEYAVEARIPSFSDREDKRELEVASVPFRIDSSDVEGLMVVTRKAAHVTGRVIFEDSSAPPVADSLRVLAVPDRTGPRLMGPQPETPVRPDLTFERGGLFGPTAILPSRLPRNWIVKAIRYKGQDITDMWIDFTGARPEDTLEVTLTQHGARVAGRVTHVEGKGVEDARVVLIAADPARRKGPFAPRTAQVKADGAFEIGPVRPGEYLIAAVDRDDAFTMGTEREDWERMIARVAQRITLVEDDRQTLDLRVTRPR
jgi:carboxypeptidase family protein